MLEVFRSVTEFRPVRVVGAILDRVGGVVDEYDRLAHQTFEQPPNAQVEAAHQRRLSAIKKTQQVLALEGKPCAPLMVRNLLVRGDV